MNNTKQNNDNTENENSLSEERQDVTCSEERTELSTIVLFLLDYFKNNPCNL